MSAADGVVRETIERVKMSRSIDGVRMTAEIEQTEERVLARAVRVRDELDSPIGTAITISSLAEAELVAETFAAIVSEMRDYARRLKARG